MPREAGSINGAEFTKKSGGWHCRLYTYAAAAAPFLDERPEGVSAGSARACEDQ